MAHIFVRNSLNNTIAVKLNATFIKAYDVAYDGEDRWVLEVATTYPSASGTKIPPHYTDIFDATVTNLDHVITQAVSEIASKIDWEPFVLDDTIPYVAEVTPKDNTVVGINSNVYIDIKDDIPSAGIDMSDAKIIINNGVQDFNITDECKITGNPFYFNVEWVPSIREYNTYDDD